jgi:hypothetical protein
MRSGSAVMSAEKSDFRASFDAGEGGEWDMEEKWVAMGSGMRAANSGVERR